ncbi:MAG: hypothetical protein ACKVOI_18140 [Dongiaceae bacterium]
MGGKAGAIHQAPFLPGLEAMGGGLTAGIVFARRLCGSVAVQGKLPRPANFNNKELTAGPQDCRWSRANINPEMAIGVETNDSWR